MPSSETYYQLSGSYKADEYDPEMEARWDELVTSLGEKQSFGAGMGLGLRDIDWEFASREVALKVLAHLREQPVTWAALQLTGYTVEYIYDQEAGKEPS